MKKLIHDVLYRVSPRLWFVLKHRVENEYQQFAYSRGDIAAYGTTLNKLRAMWPVFPWAVGGKTFLEIGCDSGFFPIQAALLGAKRSLGIDRNPDALSKADKVARRLSVENVEFRQGIVPSLDLKESFDTLLFMSTIHYMFSDCRGNDLPFTTMQALIDYLSAYVDNLLLLEFVTPQDRTARQLVKDELLRSGEYSQPSLLKALHRHYNQVLNLGSTDTPARQLYLASRQPLQLLQPQDRRHHMTGSDEPACLGTAPSGWPPSCPNE